MGKNIETTCQSGIWRWPAKQHPCSQNPCSRGAVKSCCRKPSSPCWGLASLHRKEPSTRSTQSQRRLSESSASSSSSQSGCALFELGNLVRDRNSLYQEHTWAQQGNEKSTGKYWLDTNLCGRMYVAPSYIWILPSCPPIKTFTTHHSIWDLL